MMLAAGHGDLSPLWRSLPSALFCGLAVVTVLALGFDPFVQQVLPYRTRNYKL